VQPLAIKGTAKAGSAGNFPVIHCSACLHIGSKYNRLKCRLPRITYRQVVWSKWKIQGDNVHIHVNKERKRS